MDFSKYRQNGELSDVTVIVDSKEFKLHQFPLYTRSGYFKTKVQGGSNKQNAITLESFPGGAAVFDKVADYCYNIRIDINRENVCQLRCAAEYLEMTTAGNLAELTDRHLQEMITCAKLGRSSETVVDILLEACNLGDIAEKSKIVERCIAGVVDSWLIQSSRFSRRSHISHKEPDDLQKLVKLPVNYFKILFSSARDKNVRASVLAVVIQTYLSAVADAQDSDEGQEGTMIESENSKQCDVSEKAEEAEDEKKEEPAEDKDTEDGNKDQETVEETKDEADPPEDKKDETKDEPRKEKKDKLCPVETDLEMVLDTLLLELPDSAAFADAVEPDWAVRMVVVAEELDCEHKQILRTLIRRMIYRLTAKELAGVPAPLLCEILKEESTSDDKHVPEMVCHVIDSYLVELANKDELTVDTFKNMVQAVPAEYRSTHDGLFQILEQLLNSDKSKVTEEQRQILLEVVDYNRLNEKTLKRAYEENLVPASYITKAALSLCSKLRAELDTAKATIRTQQMDLDKYGLGKGTGTRCGFYDSYLKDRSRLLGYCSHDEDPGMQGYTSSGGTDGKLDNASGSYRYESVRRGETDGALYSSPQLGCGTNFSSTDDTLGLLEEDLLDNTYLDYRSNQYRSPGSYGTYDRYGTITPRSRSYYSPRYYSK